MAENNSSTNTETEGRTGSGKADNQRSSQYGYDFYPERHGRVEKSIFSKLTEGRQTGRAFKCISNVYACTQKGKCFE